MNEIQKKLDQISGTVEVENTKPKKKRIVTEATLKMLEEGRKKRLEMVRAKKEEKRQEKLKNGEPTNYNKPDSLRNQLSKLSKLDEISERLNNLEKNTKKVSIEIREPKEVEKPKKKNDLDEHHPTPEHLNINNPPPKKIEVENPAQLPEEGTKLFHSYNIRKPIRRSEPIPIPNLQPTLNSTPVKKINPFKNK